VGWSPIVSKLELVLINYSALLIVVNIIYLDKVNKPPAINITEPTTKSKSLLKNI